MADYFLAPSGDLEGGAAAWRLQGATAVEGNEPFKVGAASDHRSLRISADGSAATAPMCIAVEHRTMRFFAKGPASGRLAVSAVGTKPNGKQTAVRLGVIDGSGAWAPTPVVDMRFDDLTEKFENTLNVSLQFEPKGDGAWQIDDVYVDPYRSN
jgi:hypothetical protein